MLYAAELTDDLQLLVLRLMITIYLLYRVVMLLTFVLDLKSLLVVKQMYLLWCVAMKLIQVVGVVDNVYDITLPMVECHWSVQSPFLDSCCNMLLYYTLFMNQ